MIIVIYPCYSTMYVVDWLHYLARLLSECYQRDTARSQVQVGGASQSMEQSPWVVHGLGTVLNSPILYCINMGKKIKRFIGSKFHCDGCKFYLQLSLISGHWQVTTLLYEDTKQAFFICY